MRIFAALVLLAALAPSAIQTPQGPTALVCHDAAATGPTAEEAALAAALRREGFAPVVVSAADTSRWSDADLVVLSRADRLPVTAGPAVEALLKRGGRLIALRAPAWSTPLVRTPEGWQTGTEFARATAGDLPPHRLLDFTDEEIGRWERTANEMQSPTTYGPAQPLGGGGPALAVHITDLTSWDTLLSPPLGSPFPAGHTVTSFAARGDKDTRQLAVEWMEKDGSRWIAVVSLLTEWRRYHLKPEDFRYWTSNPARGGPHDRFRPENASRLGFGIALTHTVAVGGGPHRYWVTNVGTEPASLAEGAPAADVACPPIDAVWPRYKLYPAAAPFALKKHAEAAALPSDALPAARSLQCIHPRPRGLGFDRRRDWRWTPLIEARAPNGDLRGAAAAMVAWTGGPFANSMAASFGVQDEGWYGRPSSARAVAAVARAMRRGLYLHEAGAGAYTYFADQSPAFGAKVVNMGAPADCEVALEARPQAGGAVLVSRRWSRRLQSGETFDVKTGPASVRWPEGGLVCQVTLRQGGVVVDRLTHAVHAWRPPAKPAFITAARGEFLLAGKPWRAHGVNYMPSSGVAIEDGPYFEQWMDRQAYDPEIIGRDLRRVRGMGMNSVAVFIYGGAVPAGNLIDFLRQCRDLGIKVNLSLRPGTPMDFEWQQVRSIIETFRLRRNDTVYAYDLAWEPSFGNHVARRRWDRDWERWIEDRYGSVQAAEAAWGFDAPRADGRVTNPSDAQTVTTGPHGPMVAAYRHFLDNLLYRKYSAARALVRGIDPNHLVSFRMSEAGNPTYNWDAFMPYDFPGLGAAVDFLAPEAYGRIGDWQKVKPGVFEVAYARSAAPEKPVIWAEAGMHVWDVPRVEPDRDLLVRQGAYYRDVYRMLRMSRSNGIYFWWYPGGFRFGENSDYGIINPDGTDRPVTRAIRDEGPAFMRTPPVADPNIWIGFNRDLDPRGVYGIYERAQAAFWRAVAAGKRPGLRPVAPDVDSRTVSLQAVGNLPAGSGPPRLLDAAFDGVRADGRAVLDGDRVTARAGSLLAVRVALRNTGPVTWAGRAAGTPRRGEVVVRAAGPRGASGGAVGRTLPRRQAVATLRMRVPAAGDAAQVRLRPAAHGRADFGDAFRFTVVGQ